MRLAHLARTAYTHGVKVLSNGHSLVRASYQFGRGREFVPFTRETYAEYEFYLEPNYPETIFYVAFDFTLKSAETFTYPIFFSTDYSTAHDLLLNFETFVSANNYVGFVGEWFNAIGRGMVYGKYNRAQWLAYLGYP